MTRKLSVPVLPKASNETGSRRKFLKAAGGAAAVEETQGRVYRRSPQPRRTLEELIAKYPQSEAAVKAKQRLGVR